MLTDRSKRLLISVIASIVLFVFGVMLLTGGVGSRELLLIVGSSLGVDPATAILHVGDSVRTDIAGARAAGLHGLHLDPHGLCDHEDHDHLQGLRDLERWLP